MRVRFPSPAPAVVLQCRSERKILKLTTLIAAVTIGFACVSSGQTVVFDNISNFENGVPGATNASTGSTPNYFMGDGYLLTPGTTNISGFDVFPVNLSGTTFTGLKITIYVWGSVNTSGIVDSITPAFGNLLTNYTVIK